MSVLQFLNRKESSPIFLLLQNQPTRFLRASDWKEVTGNIVKSPQIRYSRSMNSSPLHRAARVFHLFIAVLFFLGPPGIAPDADASNSSQRRKISKLKKTVKKLKRRLAGQQIIRVPIPVSVSPATVEQFVDMVTVGNAGNSPDQDYGGGQFGAVNYEFKIGKYEVNLDQYAAFLKAVAATDTHELYDTEMATDLNIAGIERSGTAGNYVYSVIGSGKRPITYVNWFDAARFCNWLHNGRPTGAQNAETTERGAYTLDGATSGIDVQLNRGAKCWIPSEDEWYKAAYHQFSVEGGDSDDYWLYPTGSNTQPGNIPGPSPLANHANFWNGSVWSVTQEMSLDSNQNYLTDGGAFEESESPYGTFDQGGNVWEWNDAIISGTSRGIRGGFWNIGGGTLQASYRPSLPPTAKGDAFGFRVASP